MKKRKLEAFLLTAVRLHAKSAQCPPLKRMGDQGKLEIPDQQPAKNTRKKKANKDNTVTSSRVSHSENVSMISISAEYVDIDSVQAANTARAALAQYNLRVLPDDDTVENSNEPPPLQQMPSGTVMRYVYETEVEKYGTPAPEGTRNHLGAQG